MRYFQNQTGNQNPVRGKDGDNTCSFFLSPVIEKLREVFSDNPFG